MNNIRSNSLAASQVLFDAFFVYRTAQFVCLSCRCSVQLIPGVSADKVEGVLYDYFPFFELYFPIIKSSDRLTPMKKATPLEMFRDWFTIGCLTAVVHIANSYFKPVQLTISPLVDHNIFI